jgi:hypothetical protein
VREKSTGKTLAALNDPSAVVAADGSATLKVMYDPANTWTVELQVLGVRYSDNIQADITVNACISNFCRNGPIAVRAFNQTASIQGPAPRGPNPPPASNIMGTTPVR